MRILILGSEGFIGHHLVKYLVAKNNNVEGCDLTEYNSPGYLYHKLSILSPDFDSVLADRKFDVCINASGSGNVGFSIQHPFSDFEYNTYIVAKVLDSLRKFQPGCRYVHISSAAVYGNPQQLPVKEDALPAPLSPYGFNKLMSEQLCTAYHQLYGVPIAVIRPFSVFGNGLKKQLMWDMCNKLIQDDTVQLFGTGNESRDFIHINDLALLIDIVIEKSDFKLAVYNAASGKQTTIRQIASVFENCFGVSKKIVFSGEEKKGDPLNWLADISRISALGFVGTVNLEKGIADYIQWFKANATAE